MKAKNILTTLLLVITTTLFSFAQTNPVPAQLTDLIKKAMDNYPKLKEGNEYVRLSQMQNTAAKAGYMPVIDIDATYRYQQPTPSFTIPLGTENRTLSFIPANNYDIHAGLKQTIWDFGRTYSSVRKTLTEIQTSKDNLESAKNSLAYQVAQLYYGIIFTNKEIKIQSEQIQLFGENERIVNDKIKQGDALKFDLLTTQVKKNNAENNLIDLQNMLSKRYLMLNMLTGGTGEGYITQDEVNIAEIAANASFSAEQNFDIILQNDKIKSYEQDIKSSWHSALPTINGQARIGYQNGFVPTVNQLQLAGSVGVGINIPIFNASVLRYNTKIAKFNHQAALYNLEAQKLSVNREMLQMQSDIVTSEKKLKNYELQVDRAEEAVKLANIRYKAGVITNLELLTTEADREEALLGKTQLEYNLLLSRLDLNKLGGVRLW